MVRIGQFFENYMKKESFFLDKAVLLSSYIPEEIIFRGEQLQEVANILAPALRIEKPSNLFIYGKTGTGKTITVKQTMKELCSVADKQNIPLKIIYVNCKLKKVADTEYRLVAQLAQELGRDIPPTGLPTQEIYKIFFE